MQERCRKNRIKFGIEIPNNVRKYKILDDDNNNTLWQCSLANALYNVKLAFQSFKIVEKPLVGPILIEYHIIFEVKSDLTRNIRLVADRNRNKDSQAYVKYDTVVSCNSVIIGFLISALNGMDNIAADIGNTYIQILDQDKSICIYWTIIVWSRIIR